MNPQLIGETIDETLAMLAAPPVRFPVRNREPRAPIEPLKRALIHQRDGGRCLYCGSPAYGLVLDHVIPRSSFTVADVVKIGDRSDNLQSACWDCNEHRSNFHHWLRPRPGVTPACWDCVNAGAEDVPGLPESVPAYCGRCGVTSVVPDVSWLL